MLYENWLDLQFFAGEGASAGDGGGEAAGVESADAGQSFESRLEQLGVPKDKIRKGAYKGKAAQPAAAAAQPTAATAAPTVDEQAEEPAGQEAPSGDADRKPWEEVKASYKAEYDAEVQGIVQKRLKNAQEKIQQLESRETTLAPMTTFFAKRYNLDPNSEDFAEKLVEKIRADNSLSSERALEIGAPDELAHKLDMAEVDQDLREQAKQLQARKQQLQQAFDAQRHALDQRFDELNAQAQAFAQKVPGFNLIAELQNNEAFAIMTQPGSPVTVEQAYYATHPEFRQREVESVAKRATEAVASSVRAGASRPQENGTQAASIGTIPYSKMNKADREALKQRIRDAAARGEHLPYGG